MGQSGRRSVMIMLDRIHGAKIRMEGTQAEEFG
jgi:hypothetical protein